MAVNKHVQKQNTSKLAKILKASFSSGQSKDIVICKQQKRSSEEAQYYDIVQTLLQKNLTGNKQ